MPAGIDVYANKFYGSVTESGANTLTFSEIQTNINIFDKTAWVLHRLEWYLGDQFGTLDGSADQITCALTASNNITTLDLSDPAVIDLFEVNREDDGTPAIATYFELPMIRDFTTMPGGGLIIAPRPLYVAVVGTSVASAFTVQCRGYFTQRSLKPDEYVELVDFYRILS